ATSLISNASEINGISTGINSTSSGPINLTNQSSVNVINVTGDGLVGVSSIGGGAFALNDGSVINVNGDDDVVGLQTNGEGEVTVSGASSI
ncbi:hypothetical protein, partial [Rickettsiella grylli]|uniref:hypothetical protein n=1 Tax=Rickettsiella grylli TaxID=59196 RepID=UPI000A574E1B